MKRLGEYSQEILDECRTGKPREFYLACHKKESPPEWQPSCFTDRHM